MKRPFLPVIVMGDAVLGLAQHPTAFARPAMPAGVIPCVKQHALATSVDVLEALSKKIASGEIALRPIVDEQLL